jgi:hypothetical protein
MIPTPVPDIHAERTDMNAPLPPFPPNPSIGQRSGAWVWNGSRWTCSAPVGMQVIKTFFTASAPYSPAPGLVSVTAEGMGGGGGGGSAGPVPDVDYVLAGGGGGSGSYSMVTLPASAVLGGVNVVIGAGGLPGGQGAAPGAIIDGTGGTGGDTTFGGMLVAKGGIGGAGNNANQLASPPAVTNQNGFGGAGGPAGVGQIAWPGSPGGTGVAQTTPPGSGAALQGGRGGWMGYSGGPNVTDAWNGQSANGVAAAPNTGAGGGGSIISDTGGGPLEGGEGGSGWLLTTEYCWQGAPDDDGCGCEPDGVARIPASPRYRPGGFYDD